jgi:energy-coupling factor transporter ATP-binding protein EcfA2
MKRLRIRASSPHQKVGELSGGNQQKVLLARLLCLEPKVLLLDEPTRGIDVGAKAEVQGLVEELAQQGLAVLLISSELEELVEGSDRIVVLRDGAVVDVLTDERVDAGSVMSAIADAGSARAERGGGAAWLAPSCRPRRRPRPGCSRFDRQRSPRGCRQRRLRRAAARAARRRAVPGPLPQREQPAHPAGPGRPGPDRRARHGAGHRHEGIDLSVGAVMALAAAILPLYLGYGWPVAVLMAMLVGALCGVLNGTLVAVVGVQPIVATLALLVGGRGLALVLADGQAKQILDQG